MQIQGWEMQIFQVLTQPHWGGGGGGEEGGTCSNNKTLQWHFSCFSRLLNSISILAPTLFDEEIAEEDT